MFVQFAELPVFDQDRAKRFYVDHFHCQVVADVPMNKDGWRWLELKFPGAETALHFLRRPDETPSKDPVLVFVAEDVEATVQDLASNGVTIVTKPGPAPLQSAKNGRDDRGQRKQSRRHQQPMNEPGVMTFLVPRAGVNPNRWVLRIACEDRQSIGLLYPHEGRQFNEEPVRCRAFKSSEAAH